MVIDAAGTQQTFYFGTTGFATKAGDTPASTWVAPRVASIGPYNTALFSGTRLTGVVRPSYGDIVLINLSGDLDAFLGYGLGGKVIVRVGDDGAAYPAGYSVCYIAYSHTLVCGGTFFDRLVLRVRGREQLLDKPVVPFTFLGTGGLEGTGGIGAVKQAVFGDPGFIPPILVDATKQIYFLQSTGASAPDTYLTNTGSEVNNFDVFEDGNEIDRAQPNYSSESDILGNEPAIGTVRYWFGPLNPDLPDSYDGPVYFRLHAPPTGELRVFANGEPTSADSALQGSIAGAFAFSLMALRAGVGLADIDTTRDELFVTSFLIDDERTYLEALQASASSEFGIFGFDRDDQFYSQRLLVPESTSVYYGVSIPGSTLPTVFPVSTSLFTFDRNNAWDFQRKPVEGLEAPISSVTIRSGRAFPVAQVNAAASDLMRDYLSRGDWSEVFSGESTSAAAANLGAQSFSFDVEPRVFQNELDKQIALGRFFALFGGRRHIFTFTAKMTTETLALELHDVVTLRLDRFGMSAGVKHRVVLMTLNFGLEVPSITFGIWGGDTGAYTGTATPGAPNETDPIGLQTEAGAYITDEDGFVLLIENTYVGYLQQEDDAPLLTETSDLILEE